MVGFSPPLLTGSFRLSYDRDEAYPLAFVRDRDELVPVPTPLYGGGDPIERPADESQSLIAVPSDWILAATAGTWTGPSLGTLPSSLNQIGGMGARS